jgi:lipopolysaccharide biosynthesis glycosyltransferase
MSEPQLIYTAADGNYALQAQVLVRSLVLTQNVPTVVKIFGNGWAPSELKRLESVTSNMVQAQVFPVRDESFADVKLESGFPLATAYNILAPVHLLTESGRALYLDADMVVVEDLAPLFQQQMNHAVGAVLDAHVAVIGAPSMWRPWREEGIDPLTPYLNTGTLLIDLDRWRDERITELTLEYLAKYQLPCVDQDAINLVLRGKFDRLEPRYNAMPYHLLTMFRNVDLVESDVSIGRAINEPAIVHYHRSFFGKPWTYGATHPGTKLWRQLASDVNPKWRRSFDSFNYLRGKGARFAKMTKTDHRMIPLTTSSLRKKGNN